MKYKAVLLRTKRFIPWSPTVLKFGREGTVRNATKNGEYQFIPNNMTEEEEKHVKIFGFLVSENEFYFEEKDN